MDNWSDGWMDQCIDRLMVGLMREREREKERERERTDWSGQSRQLPGNSNRGCQGDESLRL